MVGLEPTRPSKGPQDFKSCASAISPHRQAQITMMQQLTLSANLRVQPCDTQGTALPHEPPETSNNESNRRQSPHGQTLAKVKDGRKQEIRGPWTRLERFTLEGTGWVAGSERASFACPDRNRNRLCLVPVVAPVIGIGLDHGDTPPASRDRRRSHCCARKLMKKCCSFFKRLKN